MNNQQRLEQIRQHLTNKLQTTDLDVIDESHLHVGHPGAKSGAGHFAVKLSSPAFAKKNQVECHRLVYQALDDMMGSEIHALRIQIV